MDRGDQEPILLFPRSARDRRIVGCLRRVLVAGAVIQLLAPLLVRAGGTVIQRGAGVPPHIADLTNVVDIAAGNDCLALRAGGTVVCWGWGCPVPPGSTFQATPLGLKSEPGWQTQRF